MAKQRYNIGVDSLSYADSKVPYVAPPTKEILSYLDKGEERYLKTKENINLATELAKNLKYNPVSAGLYKDIVANVEDTINQITPENYADKELDTAQLAFDIKNKMGGTELEKQQAQYAAAQAEIDKADKIRPEKKDYYQSLLARQLKPITKDATGTFVVPGVSTPNLVQDIDLFEKADKLLTGWKSSGNYVRNKDGSLAIDPGVLGQLGITKTEFANEKELYDTVVNYLSNDPTNKEYLQSEADFALDNKIITPDYLKAALPANIIKSYFPNKKPEDVTANDIQALTGGNQEMLREMASHGIVSNQMNQVGTSLAAKHGFKEETKSFFTDNEYAEALKFKYAQKTKALDATPNEAMGQLVIPQTATTMQIGNPTIYDNYKAQENEAVTNYAKSREELLKLETEYNTATPDQKVLIKENLAKAKEAVQIADQEIQRARQAQDNLTKGTVQLARNKGINIDKAYTDNATNISIHNSDANRKVAQQYGYSADITNLVKSGEANKPLGGKEVRINVAGKTYNLPVYTNDQADAGKRSLASDYVIKDGNRYIIYHNNESGHLVPDYKHGKALEATNTFSNNLISAIGFNKLQDNPYARPDASGKPTSFKANIVPRTTKDGFNSMVSQLFMNPDTKFPGVPDKTVELAKQEANKIRKVAKPTDVHVNQTLDYLYVPSDVKKGTAAKRLLDISNVINKTLISQGAQYKVRNNNGEWETLPQYIKSLGLEYTSDYIDFDKVKSGIMLTSDRKYGQQFNLPLPLTKLGRETLRKEDKEAFGLAGTLNLTAVNSTGRDNPLNKNIEDAVYKAYVESYGNTMPSGDEARQAFGLITFDNSPYAEEFYNKNLYTLGHGQSTDYTLPDGNKIKITAVKRSATPDKLGDNDFFISNEQGDVYAYDVKTGRDRMVGRKEYEADTSASLYRRKLFASPEDIGGLIGTSILDRRALSGNPQMTTQQVKTTGGSYTVKSESVISNEHRTNVNNTAKQYGTSATPRAIKTYSGKEVIVNSRINPSQMTYVKDLIPGKIKPDVYPYFNNSVANNAIKIVNDYDLYVTDAYRPEGVNKARRDSAKDSLHQYGKSMDSRYNAGAQKLLTDLSNDPQIAKNLGISYAFKHTVNGVPHLHIDFE